MTGKFGIILNQKMTDDGDKWETETERRIDNHELPSWFRQSGGAVELRIDDDGPNGRYVVSR